MSWADGIIAALDIETTGLDPESDEIVQVAVIHVDRDGSLLPASWAAVVNPGRPIPPEASAVHGITTERAIREGISPEEAARQILQRLSEVAASGIPLVVYNAPFDLGFMHVRAGGLESVLTELIVIDPLVCDRAVDQYRSGSRTLQAVAAHYECAAGQLHDASNDAAVSVAVARAIALRYPAVGGLSPLELHRQQVAWHRVWAAEYVDYMAAQGRAARSVDTGWPVSHRLLSR